MADFYKVQQVCQRLGISEDELKALVREARLREFRDASGLMYRAEEVDALAAELGAAPAEPASVEPAEPVGEPAGDAGLVELTPEQVEPAEEPAPTAELVEPVEPAEPVAAAEPPAVPEPEAPGQEESSVFGLEAGATDASKTDVFSLEPGESGSEKSGSGSGSSISLLDDLENITIPADPLAETVVSTGDVDSGESGSGLLDLARESDDTSLGAELYDDYTEGEAKPEAEPEAEAAPVDLDAAEPAEYPAPVAVAVVEAAPDPMMPGLVGMAIVGLICLLVLGMVVAAAVMEAWPSLLAALYSNLLLYLGVVVLGAVIFLLVGWLVGRQSAARQAALAHAGSAAPEEPQA